MSQFQKLMTSLGAWAAGPGKREPGWLVGVAFFALHALFFIVPNACVQVMKTDIRMLPLLYAQIMNFSVLTLLVVITENPLRSRWVMIPLLAISFFSTNFLYFFGSMPSVGAFLSLMHTNRAESLEYLKIKMYLWVLILILLAIYLFLFNRILAFWGKGQMARVQKPVAGLCLAVIASYGIWAGVLVPYEPGKAQPVADPLLNSFPVGMAMTGWQAWSYCRGLKPDNGTFQFHATRAAEVAEPETYVLVIGESAYAGNWSLGGYSLDTTPRMRALERAGSLTYFQRAVAQANVTALAVPMIVSPATPADFAESSRVKTLVSAFREAGFTTYWISNQDEPSSINEAEFPILLHPRSGSVYTNYDQDLWPFLEAALDSPRPKKLIVLHLMGSHVEYQARVPQAFKTPDLPGTSLLNQYLRTIAYTDAVLDGFIQRLGRVPGRAFLWYVSDHGQILRPGEVGHGSLVASLNEFHVPMFIWTNPRMRAAAPARLLSLAERKHDVISQGVTFPTLLGLGGVTYPGLDATRDLSSDAFVSGRKPEILNPSAKIKALDLFP